MSYRPHAGWFFGIGLLLWLLFFPNAPYLVTDLLHLRYRPPIPFWYDLMLLFGAALTGLSLGLVSLFEVHLALARRMRSRSAWAVLVCLVGMGSFGVWLGRYHRWNSWDFFLRPDLMIADIFRTLTTTHGLLQAGGVSVLFFTLMGLSYSMLYLLAKTSKQYELKS